MTDTLINASGRCGSCGGTVKNVDGKRHTKERLTEIHRATCAGVQRGRRAA